MNFIKRLLLPLICAISLGSCTLIENLLPTELSLATTSTTLTAEGQSTTFEIAANKSWTATTTQPWIHLSVSEGKKSASFNFSVDSNIEEAVRKGSITITSNDVTETFYVTQSGISSIVSVTTIDFNSDGSIPSQSFNLTTQSAWSIETTDTKATPTWFEVSPKSGTGNATVTVKILEDNPYYDDRNAYIKVIMNQTTFFVTLTQKYKNAVIASRDVVELPSTGGDFDIKIGSTVDYSVVIPAESSWIKRKTAASTKALTEKVEYFTAEGDSEDSKKEGMIIFKGVVSDTVKVYLAQQTVLVLSNDIVSVPSQGAVFDVQLRTNIEYDVDFKGATWVRSIDSKAVRVDKITLEADAYNSDTPRTASIIFKDKNSTLSDTLFITQSKELPINFMNTIGVYSGTTPIYSYVAGEDQISMTSSSQHSFRMMNTFDKKFFSISSIPATLSTSQSFLATIESLNIKGVEEVGQHTLFVSKIDGNKVWLYDITHNLGYIINK